MQTEVVQYGPPMFRFAIISPKASACCFVGKKYLSSPDARDVPVLAASNKIRQLVRLYRAEDSRAPACCFWGGAIASLRALVRRRRRRIRG